MDPTQFLDHVYAAPNPGTPLHWSFREFMEACMFDPEVGYYGSGKVSIGLFADYWTYPVRLSPLFGELLALRVLSLWRGLRQRVEEAGEPFYLVELGGGRGELLRDTVLALRRRGQTDAAAQALVARLELLAVDKSAALLADQATAQEDLLVRHVPASATEVEGALPQPFYGLIFANELLTQLSVELLRLEEGRAERLRVLPWVGGPLADLGASLTGADRPPGIDAELLPLRPSALPELIRRLGADKVQLRAFAAREGVRWTGALEPIAGDSAVADYVARSAAVTARLGRTGGLPAWVAFAPEVGRVLDGIAKVLASGAGAFATADYGGTAWHVFDARSRYKHLRTFSRLLDGAIDEGWDDEYRGKNHNPVRAPGCEDLTYDLDFTWAIDRLQRGGLSLAFYGHQGALESGVNLWKAPYQAQLVAGRAREGYSGPEGVARAHDLLKRFRAGGGFQLLVVTSPGLDGAFADLGRSDPVLRADLDGLPASLQDGAGGDGLRDALLAGGMDAARADRCLGALHPGGSPIDDLGDEGLYASRGAVIEAARQGDQRPSRRSS